MTAAPTMTWWVRARLADGARGWLRLASDGQIENFPIYAYAESLLAWEYDRIRDDETPDCRELLAQRERDEPVD